MSRVSAIVPTFNRARLLPACLAAIRAQTRPVDEIVVIDDGSTDDTAAVVAAEPGPVRYVRQDNAGKSMALNRGLAVSTGDLVWICDDDDVALPRAVERLAGAIERTGAGFAFGCYARFEADAGGETHLLPRGYWPDLEGRSPFIALMEDFFLFQNATLVRREAYREVGPFRTDLVRSQDYEMALRLARAFEGVHVDEEVFLQRVHEGDRGSAAERFDASGQVDRWVANDQVIFEDWVARLPLCEFAREAAAAEGPLRTRAALLQRACVFTRRRMWDIAAADLLEAARIEPGQGLDAQEQATCRRFLLSKYGCDWFVDDPRPTRDLERLARAGGLGREIARHVTRPLLWRTREAMTGGQVTTALSFAGLMARIHAPVFAWA